MVYIFSLTHFQCQSGCKIPANQKEKVNTQVSAAQHCKPESSKFRMNAHNAQCKNELQKIQISVV